VPSAKTVTLKLEVQHSLTAAALEQAERDAYEAVSRVYLMTLDEKGGYVHDIKRAT
jgi:hypothetical protein